MKMEKMTSGVVMGMLVMAGGLSLSALGYPEEKPASKSGETASADGANGGKKLLARKRSEGPTRITADRLEFDYREMIALFEDNVVVTDPELNMTADRMLVYFDGTNEVRQVTARGEVRVKSGNRSADCDKAVYLRNRGQLILTGNVVLRRDRNVLSGHRITFWINDERVEVEPGKMIIHPENDDMGSVLP